MELYKLGLPAEDAIIVKDKFLVNSIIPLCLKKANDNNYIILFIAEQHSTESRLYLQTIVAASNEADEGFLINHPLNIINIQRDKERLDYYNEMVDGMKGNTFNTDFDMDECEDNKRFFHTSATKPIFVRGAKEPQAAFIDLIITRDNFLRISLFFTKFLIHDDYAESMFITHKLKNVEFEHINHVKLDASTLNRSQGVVYNHYTMGNGPSIYRMTFISPIKENGTLINQMSAEYYTTFYSKDFVIRDIIYDHHKDRIFIIYELRSDITNNYKATRILILDKEMYDHTNFVDVYKVYEK